MKTIAVDANNDIYVSRSNMLAVATDVHAVQQGCEQAVRTRMGEMIYAANRGIPFDEVVWRNVNPAQFEAAARRVILSVDHVIAITDFTVTIGSNVLRYTATIQSEFGIFEVTSDA